MNLMSIPQGEELSKSRSMAHMYMVYVLFYIVWNLFKFLEMCGITFDVNSGKLRDAKIPVHELNSFLSVSD
jgi:hypothetical protein